eukprot:1154640-Pelagomonas_calceolata.AAC.5
MAYIAGLCTASVIGVNVGQARAHASVIGEDALHPTHASVIGVDARQACAHASVDRVNAGQGYAHASVRGVNAGQECAHASALGVYAGQVCERAQEGSVQVGIQASHMCPCGPGHSAACFCKQAEEAFACHLAQSEQVNERR